MIPLCGAEGADQMLPVNRGPRLMLAEFNLSHFRSEIYAEALQRATPYFKPQIIAIETTAGNTSSFGYAGVRAFKHQLRFLFKKCPTGYIAGRNAGLSCHRIFNYGVGIRAGFYLSLFPPVGLALVFGPHHTANPRAFWQWLV